MERPPLEAGCISVCVLCDFPWRDDPQHVMARVSCRSVFQSELARRRRVAPVHTDSCWSTSDRTCPTQRGREVHIKHTNGVSRCWHVWPVPSGPLLRLSSLLSVARLLSGSDLPGRRDLRVGGIERLVRHGGGRRRWGGGVSIEIGSASTPAAAAAAASRADETKPGRQRKSGPVSAEFGDAAKHHIS
jgi:hypothetical protein